VLYKSVIIIIYYYYYYYPTHKNEKYHFNKIQQSVVTDGQRLRMKHKDLAFEKKMDYRSTIQHTHTHLFILNMSIGNLACNRSNSVFITSVYTCKKQSTMGMCIAFEN